MVDMVDKTSKLLVMMDTSVALCYVGHVAGFAKTDGQCNWDVKQFVQLTDGKKIIISTTAASEFDILIKVAFKDKNQKKIRTDNNLDMAYDEAQQTINQISKIDNSGLINDVDYDPSRKKQIKEKFKSMRQLLMEHMQWRISKPCGPEATDWLKRKSRSLNMERNDIVFMTNEEKRDKLKTLLKRAKNDVRILSLATVHTDTNPVLFVSSDGDHLTLSDFMKKITCGKMIVVSPNEAIRYLEGCS